MKPALLLVVTGLAACAVSAALAEPFVFVSLPDTQVYSENRFPGDGGSPVVTDPRGTAEIFNDQTRWIVDNAAAFGIRYVGHLGDIVQTGTNLDEWDRAKAAMDLLREADIPHGTAMGNHDDIPPQHGTDYRANYLAYFGPPVFAGHPWYAGASPEGGANYQLLEHEGIRLGFLNFSIDQPKAEIEWAHQIIAGHPDRIFVIGTHRYLYDYIFLAGRYGEPIATPIGPITIDSDPVEGAVAPRNGQELFEEFVSQHPNIVMIHAGHSDADWLRLVEGDTLEHRVVEILTDYQSTRNGGDGWLRIYSLDFDANTFHFETYSPTLDRYRTTIDRFVEVIYFAYSQKDLVTDLLGITDEQYFKILGLLKDAATAPEDFLLSHPDFDEPRERAYYRQYLADLFGGEIEEGFENIAAWERLWLIAFAADPSNPLDFSDGRRSPRGTIDVDYQAYYTPTPEQTAVRALYQAVNAIAALEAADFVVPAAQANLTGEVQAAIAAAEQGSYRAALDRASGAGRRTDGCALRGAPDTGVGFDSILNCNAQGQVYPPLSAAIALFYDLLAGRE